MPSFEDMQRHYTSFTTIGSELKNESNLFVNETFKNGTTYRKGIIYDCTLKPIQEIEFKFLKTKTYFYAISMGILLSGAICNLYDRIAFGYVRDFIKLDFMNFPIFNI